MSATHEFLSGASRMVAEPATRMDQSFAATKELPRTVVLAVSTERRSEACPLTVLIAGLTDEFWPCPNIKTELRTQTKPTRALFMRTFKLSLADKASRQSLINRPDIAFRQIVQSRHFE